MPAGHLSMHTIASCYCCCEHPCGSIVPFVLFMFRSWLSIVVNMESFKKFLYPASDQGSYSLTFSFRSHIVVVNFAIQPKLQLQYTIFTKHVVSYGCRIKVVSHGRRIKVINQKHQCFFYILNRQNLWEWKNLMIFNKSSAIFYRASA